MAPVLLLIEILCQRRYYYCVKNIYKLTMKKVSVHQIIGPALLKVSNMVLNDLLQNHIKYYTLQFGIHKWFEILLLLRKTTIWCQHQGSSLNNLLIFTTFKSKPNKHLRWRALQQKLTTISCKTLHLKCLREALATLLTAPTVKIGH